MSAWAQIVNSDGSDEWLELCNKALTEVQAETRRKMAAKLRNAKVDNPLGEAEEHVNFVLDDLARDIERGS
ncbi:hypothetical protein AB0P05_26620 [Streptomyces flaveolus]|uniref:hypothetical protein n=1 Tax=Streptomyces flaveolus TaxID=67297 RepID=UPI00344AEC2D